jgi:hypothetical protein
MVTSRNNTALSLQAADVVPAMVAEIVAAGGGVKVAGTKPGLVGGKVAVTNPACSGVGRFESVLIEMHAASKNALRKIIFLNMELRY